MSQGKLVALSIGLDEAILDHPVTFPVQVERLVLDSLDAVLPHRQGALLEGRETAPLVVAKRPVQVFALDVEGTELPSVCKAHLAPARDVMADLANRPNGVLQREVADDDARVFQHAQQDARGADLEKSRVLAHVRVTDDHVQPSEALSVRVRLVPGVDDRPAPRRRGGDTFPDVLGPLAKAEHRATSGLENLARPAVDLPAHEERDQHLYKVREVVPAAGEVILVAPVGIARGVGVVLEQVDHAADALVVQPALG